MAWACDFGLGERAWEVLPPSAGLSLCPQPMGPGLPGGDHPLGWTPQTCTAARDSQLLDSLRWNRASPEPLGELVTAQLSPPPRHLLPCPGFWKVWGRAESACLKKLPGIPLLL